MPNYCNNTTKIKFEKKETLEDFVNFFNTYESIEKGIVKKGSLGIIVETITAWKPDYKWLEEILNKYSECWIKSEWHEEGGIAGVWVGYFENGEKNIEYLHWRDLSIEEEYHCFDK